jgi:hypothetical protein
MDKFESFEAALVCKDEQGFIQWQPGYPPPVMATVYGRDGCGYAVALVDVTTGNAGDDLAIAQKIVTVLEQHNQ